MEVSWYSSPMPSHWLKLVGLRFGRLVVLSRVRLAEKGWFWKCRCDCGNECEVTSSNLRTGHKRSCGCLDHPNLEGQRFGKLIARSMIRHGHKGSRFWICDCDCGKQTAVLPSSLISGKTKSCGCLQAQVTAKRNFRHGLSHTPEMMAYYSAKRRCTNPAVAGYKDYGGRGIEFRFEKFEDFFAEVGPRPPGKKNGMAIYSLDRIKNDGHYEKGNLRWATRSEQMKNSRANPPRKKPYIIRFRSSHPLGDNWNTLRSYLRSLVPEIRTRKDRFALL